MTGVQTCALPIYAALAGSFGSVLEGNTYPSNMANGYTYNWEYGTFNVGISGAASGGTATYVKRAIRYRLCSSRSLELHGRLSFNGYTGTGQMRIFGMPYNNSGDAQPVQVAEATVSTANAPLYLSWTGSNIIIKQLTPGGLPSDVPSVSVADLAFSTRIFL